MSVKSNKISKIGFNVITRDTRFLDPRRGFAETTLSFEVRSDPLVQHKCRILRYRYPPIRAKPDLSPLIEKSLEMGCPFCPQVMESAAAKFPPDLLPEGRIQLDEATVIPNIAPYNKYGAVTIISARHFIGLADFTEELLVDGFLASQTYLRRVAEYEPEVKYHSISWNYMPQAGAGMLHPHIQVQADDFPFNYEEKLLAATRSYFEQNSTNYYRDLIEEEQERGERYIGTIGNVVWLTPFVPSGVMPDVMAIFKERDAIIHLTEADFKDFAQGLCRVFKYLSDQNFYSFNLAIYSGSLGQDYLWTTAKIVPRMPFPPLDVSDHHQMTALHDEAWTARSPEEVCSELKAYF